jgi:hypothetical protein
MCVRSVRIRRLQSSMTTSLGGATRLALAVLLLLLLALPIALWRLQRVTRDETDDLFGSMLNDHPTSPSCALPTSVAAVAVLLLETVLLLGFVSGVSALEHNTATSNTGRGALLRLLGGTQCLLLAAPTLVLISYSVADAASAYHLLSALTTLAPAAIIGCSLPVTLYAQSASLSVFRSLRRTQVDRCRFRLDGEVPVYRLPSTGDIKWSLFLSHKWAMRLTLGLTRAALRCEDCPCVGLAG